VLHATPLSFIYNFSVDDWGFVFLVLPERCPLQAAFQIGHQRALARTDFSAAAL